MCSKKFVEFGAGLTVLAQDNEKIVFPSYRSGKRIIEDDV